jgi:UDP-N-acetylmuramoyl-L-alanyl-D-glutamate--2,6-diaminopimelate ligase
MALRPSATAGMALGDLFLEAQLRDCGTCLVRGLALDSRKVAPGDLFIALAGAAHDGRNFLAQAAAAGAVAAIVEAGIGASQRAAAATLPVIEVAGLGGRLGYAAAMFYGQPSAAMQLLGVTGTNGKTTTTQLIAQLLRLTRRPCGVIGTLGASLSGDVVAAVNTTPDAITLNAQLAQWRDQQVDYAALEVSSHSLSQERVNGLDFAVAVFTNLSRDHLDYHGDMDSYGAAKARLLDVAALRHAVINVDDSFGHVLMQRAAPSVDCISYSATGAAADVCASAVRYHSAGLLADVATPWGSGSLDSALVGDFNLGNLLAAVATVCALDVPLAEVLAAVPSLQCPAGRMESVPNDSGLQLVVDYAHSPDALAAALRALRVHCQGQLICVFGCGGDRDVGKRAQMGAIAAQLADHLIVTSDNPRSETPLHIIDDILAGCAAAQRRGAVTVEADRAAAIALAVTQARPGDSVLIAGKGHERYQQVGSVNLPFDDVAQVRAALRERAAP